MTILVNKWGFNPSVDVMGGGFEDVIAEGGLHYWAATESILQVSSTSLNDVAGGTGAYSLHIEGLDSNFREVHEDVPLNGLTVVNSKHKFYRVNRAYVLTSGSSDQNEGGITIGDGTGTLAFIGVDTAQTEQAVYTVPDGEPVSLNHTNLVLLEKSNNWVSAALFVRRHGTTTWRIRDRLIASDDAPHGRVTHIHLVTGDDVRVTCIDASANGLQVSGGFSIEHE